MARFSFVNSGEFQEWKSIGDQISFSYDNELECVECVAQLHNTLINRLNYVLETYNISIGCVTGVQFIINKVEYSDYIKPNKLTEKSVGENKDLFNYSVVSAALNKLLPLSMDLNKFGSPLRKIIYNNSVESITLIDGSVINLLERINKYLGFGKQMASLDDDLQIFQKSLPNMGIIITVRSFNDFNDIDVYNLNGMKLLHAKDFKLSIKNHFTRTIGNVVVYINETGIYNKEILSKLEPVKPRVYKGQESSMVFKDYRVGTLDLEAYNESAEISKTYCIGFYADNKVKTYYINKNLDSDCIIISCLDDLLTEKYHRYTFYVHNMGKYDA